MAEQTEISRGVSYYAEMTVLDAAGEADDLTGHTFRASVRRPGGAKITDLDSKVTLKGGTTNVVVFALTAADSWAIPAGEFEWDVLTDRPSAAGTDIIVPTEPFIVTTPRTQPA